MHSRRALLYMPGNDLHKITKATTLGVDCICMDMEDGVAVNQKMQARTTIAHALHTLDFGSAERLARINPVGSGLEPEDIQIVVPARPDGIVIPKVENADQIQWVSRQIGAIESANDWPLRSIYLIAIVESARAILNLREICEADGRLQALIFGAEDLLVDIGAIRTPERWEVFYARSAVITTAVAYGLQAIDMVNPDFTDLEQLRKESLQGMQMGYHGKQIIHPNQVQPVQEAFTPTEAAIANAVRIVEAFKQQQQSGVGAFAVDGIMIDAPVVKIAERVLERARAAGKL